MTVVTKTKIRFAIVSIVIPLLILAVMPGIYRQKRNGKLGRRTEQKRQKKLDIL